MIGMKPRIPKHLKVAILADYLAGISPTEIARRYGVSDTRVANLRRRSGYPSQKAMREARGWDRANEATETSA